MLRGDDESATRGFVFVIERPAAGMRRLRLVIRTWPAINFRLPDARRFREKYRADRNA